MSYQKKLTEKELAQATGGARDSDAQIEPHPVLRDDDLAKIQGADQGRTVMGPNAYNEGPRTDLSEEETVR